MILLLFRNITHSFIYLNSSNNNCQTPLFKEILCFVIHTFTPWILIDPLLQIFIVQITIVSFCPPTGVLVYKQDYNLRAQFLYIQKHFKYLLPLQQYLTGFLSLCLTLLSFTNFLSENLYLDSNTMISLWLILLLQASQAINFSCMIACLASPTSIGKHQESNFHVNIFSTYSEFSFLMIAVKNCHSFLRD